MSLAVLDLLQKREIVTVLVENANTGVNGSHGTLALSLAVLV